MQYTISNWIFGIEPLLNQLTRLAKYGYQGIELVGYQTKLDPDVDSLCKLAKHDTLCDIYAQESIQYPGEKVNKVHQNIIQS